jgi:hypothetical protein
VLLALPFEARAQQIPTAPALAPRYYVQYCASCHDNPDASHAPTHDRAASGHR